jgi:hypothetical protein
MKNSFGLLILSVAAFLGYKAVSKKSTSEIVDSLLPDNQPLPQLPSNTTQPSTTVPSSPVVANVYPLQVGSRGDLVKILQKALGVSIDGIFGEKTKAALVLKYAIEKVLDLATLNRIINGTQPVTVGQTSKPATAVQYPTGTMMLAMYQKVTSNGKTYWIERGFYDNEKILSLLEVRIGNTIQDRSTDYLRGLKKAFDSYYTRQPFLSTIKDVKLATSLAQSSNAKVQRFAKIIATL